MGSDALHVSKSNPWLWFVSCIARWLEDMSELPIHMCAEAEVWGKCVKTIATQIVPWESGIKVL